MTQLVSHPIRTTRESLLPATQLRTYAKFTPKQNSITLAIMHVQRATGLSSIAIAMVRM